MPRYESDEQRKAARCEVNRRYYEKTREIRFMKQKQSDCDHKEELNAKK